MSDPSFLPQQLSNSNVLYALEQNKGNPQKASHYIQQNNRGQQLIQPSSQQDSQQPQYFYDQNSGSWYNQKGEIVQFQNYGQDEIEYLPKYSQKQYQDSGYYQQQHYQNQYQSQEGAYQLADRHQSQQHFKIKQFSPKSAKTQLNSKIAQKDHQPQLQNNGNQANYYRNHIYRNQKQDNQHTNQNWRSQEIYSQNIADQIPFSLQLPLSYNKSEQKKQENGDRVPLYLPLGKKSQQEREKSQGDHQHTLENMQFKLQITETQLKNVQNKTPVIKITKNQKEQQQVIELSQKKQLLKQKQNIDDKRQNQEKLKSQQEHQRKEKKHKKHKKQKNHKEQNENKKITMKEQNKNQGKIQKIQQALPPPPKPLEKGPPGNIVQPIVQPSASLVLVPEAEQSIKSGAIIKQAQKQRIETTLKLFIQYISKHRLAIINQQSAYINIFEELDRRKTSKYVWYHIIKQYFQQYQKLSRNFHQKSYKIHENEQIVNKNIYLNIGEQLKQGVDQLTFLKKQTGNIYSRLNDFTNNKICLQLQVAFNKFISQINKSQQNVQDKKKIHLQLEDQFKKKTQKLTKIYNKGKQGKKQDEDVFVQTCQFIQLEKQYRNSLIDWGKSIIQVRKLFITSQQKLNDQVQGVLNTFKNTLAGVYSFHPQKFQKIINSKDQVARQTKYGKLCTLSDSDYIKYSMEVIKSPISQIKDKNFQNFVEMPHFQLIVGKSTLLLKGMVNKSFQLKDVNEELINTISGNLVQFNKQNSMYKDKFVIKNLQANIVADGVVQFDQIIPGIIFDDRRSIRLSLKDQDRAEELICMLNEKI